MSGAFQSLGSSGSWELQRNQLKFYWKLGIRPCRRRVGPATVNLPLGVPHWFYPAKGTGVVHNAGMAIVTLHSVVGNFNKTPHSILSPDMIRQGSSQSIKHS
jgi:hypothetical protein